MATKKRASVYMLRATTSGVYDGRHQYEGEFVRIGYESRHLGGDPSTFSSARRASFLRREMRKAGVRTEIVRFMEVA